MIVVAFSAAVCGNYLTLTARHLIQTQRTTEKKKKKHRENGEREREKKEEKRREEKGLKGRWTEGWG